MVSAMFRGAAARRKRDRDLARELAEQTANRIAARDNRLRTVGLRVNDNNTVTGDAEQDLPGGARVRVRFEAYPADNALGVLTREIERLQAHLDGNFGAVGMRVGEGWVNVRIGRRPPEARTSEEKLAATEKARETLKSFLSPEQRKTYEEDRHFEVVGSKGTRYRIKTDGNASGNVLWLRKTIIADSYIIAGKYCAYPKGYLPNGLYIPVEDQFLGQMLQLITDEDSYLDKANLFSGNFPTHHPKHATYARRLVMEGRLDEGAPCDCAGCEELKAADHVPLPGRLLDPRAGYEEWLRRPW